MWREDMGVPNQPKTPGRSVRVPDLLWDAGKATAADRGDHVSDPMRDGLEAYTLVPNAVWAAFVRLTERHKHTMAQEIADAITEHVKRHK